MSGFIAISKSNQAILNNACADIKNNKLLPTVNGKSIIEHYICKVAPLRPKVDIWSALWWKQKDQDEVNLFLHDKLMNGSRPTDVFINVCRDLNQNGNQLKHSTDSLKHFTEAAEYFNNLIVKNVSIPVKPQWHSWPLKGTEEFDLLRSWGMNDQIIFDVEETDDAILLKSLAAISEEETRALCRVGKEKYQMNLNDGSEQWWEDNMYNLIPYHHRLYWVAVLVHANKWKSDKAQVLINLDSRSWAAFTESNFDNSMPQCKAALDAIPLDIHDEQKALQWKELQSHLRKRRNQCWNLEHAVNYEIKDRKLEEKVVLLHDTSATSLCSRLSNNLVKSNHKFTVHELHTAVLTCKTDLENVARLFPNKYDKAAGDGSVVQKVMKALADDGEIELGDIAYWENVERKAFLKWYPVIDAIYIQAWTRILDSQARMCEMMTHMEKSQLARLEKAFPGDSWDMKEFRENIERAYKSVAPKTRSGYIFVDQNKNLVSVPTLKIRVKLGTNANFADLKPKIIQYVQQYVDIGAADEVTFSKSDGIATMIYDRTLDEIKAQTEGLATLSKEGVKVDKKHFEIVNIAVPNQFEDINLKLQNAGANMKITDYRCVIDVKTAVLQTHEIEQKPIEAKITKTEETKAPAKTTEKPTEEVETTNDIKMTPPPVVVDETSGVVTIVSMALLCAGVLVL
jgi:hypothetical protein